MGAGSPVKYTPKLIAEIKANLDEFVETSAIPIIAEFCYKHNIRKQRLYEIPELSDSIKGLIEKKEAQLEKLALAGKINTTFAIFSLKQIGWRDTQTVDDISKSRPVQVKIKWGKSKAGAGDE